MKNTPKILIIPSPPLGGKIESGQDRYLDALVKRMAGRAEFIGLDDPQYARGPDKKWEQSPVHAEVHPRYRLTHLIPRNIRLLLGYVRDAWRLSRLLRPYRDQFDLLHVNRVGCETQTIAARLAGFGRVVTTIHNLPGDTERDNWVCRLVEWFSFKCGDVHIAVSEATYESWHERVGLRKRETIDRRDKAANAPRSKVHGLWSKVFSHRPRGKCVTIYNGMDPIDLTGFDRRAYRQQFCNDPDHTFIIGICARLHRMKGHLVLLEAFAQQLQENRIQNPESRIQNSDEQIPFSSSPVTRYPSLLLLIAGSGPEEENIKTKIAELGIGDHVKLLGHRNDAEKFVASLDLNVLPSIELETLGYSVVEAMFHGVPSVVSDVGGMKEIIRASGGGRVVPAGNVGALAEAMTTFVKDPVLREQAGRVTQEYARRELTAGKMAALTLQAYGYVTG